MKMKTLALALIALAMMQAFTSCKNDGFKKTDSGLRYKVLFSNDTGRQIAEGDLITFHTYSAAGDSVFMNTWQMGMPFQNMAIASQYPGDVYEGFKLMKTGDSVLFELNADSLFQRTFQQPSTPEFAIGKTVSMYVKMVEVMSKAEYEKKQADQQKEMEEFQRKQEENSALEGGKIDSFIAANKLKNVQKTETGLRYIVTAKGKGGKANRGDRVKVHYTGTLLSGQKFDSSVDRGEPFEFEAGMNQVIAGWDEGIMLMNIGDKFKFIIPFSLGYGFQEMPNIPAFSTLVFDVELLEVSAPASATAPPQQPGVPSSK